MSVIYSWRVEIIQCSPPLLRRLWKTKIFQSTLALSRHLSFVKGEIKGVFQNFLKFVLSLLLYNFFVYFYNIYFMQKLYYIWVCGLLVTLASCTTQDTSQEEVIIPQETVSTEIRETVVDQKAMKEEVMQQKPVQEPQVSQVVSETRSKLSETRSGVYAEYSEDALTHGGDTVLFFHAAWCPSCRTADAALSSAKIPAGLSILKTDFDSQRTLRKEYGIVSQHTFVHLDSEGNFVKKWVGGNSLEGIVEQVKSL